MRLIDADAFERSVMCSDAEDMQDVIYALRDYPTAYDPDKVVEQLEDRSTLSRPVGWTKSYEIITLKDAVEIVKGGGVDGENGREENITRVFQ